MMTTSSYLRSIGVLLFVIVFLSVFETAMPFFRAADARRRHFGTNWKLTATTLGMNFVFNAGVVLATERLGLAKAGWLASTSLSPVAWTIIAVVLLDASTYVCHRSMHWVPFLWKAHSVHHADPLVDVTTAFRLHPVETTWRFVFIVLPASLLGLPAHAVAAYRVVSAFMALFEHTNVKLWQPIDTALSWVVGTPNMHKLHHSRLESQTNSNYGNIFSLFDRALGTFTPTARSTTVRYGLDAFPS